MLERAAKLPNSIILTGFMGSGKTVTGRVLARMLGWRFVDLDQEIGRRAGITVSRIFRMRGEAAFRDMEHRAVRGLNGRSRLVVAVGGGAPVFPRNRTWLARAGLVVWLRVPVAILVRRLSRSGGRPLLAGVRGDRRALAREVRRLLRGRVPAYARAGMVVDAGRGSPASVAAAIVRRCGLDTR